MTVQGLPGGGVFAISTTPVAVDLGPLQGYEVFLFCATQDILFSFTPDASTSTALASTATAASLTELVADAAAQGRKVQRQVLVRNSRLVVATVAGSGLLVVKPIRQL